MTTEIFESLRWLVVVILVWLILVNINRAMSLDMFNFYYEDNKSDEYFSLLEKTIQLDPTYSEAHAYLSMFNFLSAVRNSFIGDDSVIESD